VYVPVSSASSLPASVPLKARLTPPDSICPLNVPPETEPLSVPPEKQALPSSEAMPETCEPCCVTERLSVPEFAPSALYHWPYQLPVTCEWDEEPEPLDPPPPLQAQGRNARPIRDAVASKRVNMGGIRPGAG